MADHIYKQNLETIDSGVVRHATKLEVVTIGLGPIKDLGVLCGSIWYDYHGNVVVSTKENPEGFIYNQDRTLVVRILGGQVKIKGRYDLYAPEPEKLHKLLKNRFDVASLPERQFEDLEPLFAVASDIQGAIAPSEERWVIVITRAMLRGSDHLVCELPLEWADKPTFANLYEGDVFVIEDKSSGKGYRIGKEEFELTHKLN